MIGAEGPILFGVLAQQQGLIDDRKRLAAAIASGGELTALLDALKDRERQRESLTRQLAALDAVAGLSSVDVATLERICGRRWRSGARCSAGRRPSRGRSYRRCWTAGA